MPTVQSILENAFKSAISSAFSVDADPLLAPATNPQFGDYQSNVAMSLAKAVKSNPRAVAQKIADNLNIAEIAEVSIAGPGFLNIKLKRDFLERELAGMLKAHGSAVGRSEKPQTVVVDYSGPNVAKQMHVGHLRSTIIGDAIARVLEYQGHKIIRQNHIGDWGTQFGMLIAYLRETHPSGDAHIEDLDKFYKEARKRFDADPKFADEARATVVRLQSGGQEELSLWNKIVEESRRHFQPIYEALGVKLTRADERGESNYNPMLPHVVEDLRKLGIATESEGATVVFTEGFENPLIIEKTGGGYGYATTDLAAIRYRVGTLGASRIIYFVGAPQSQHFKQVFDTARRAGWATDALLEHAAFGSVLGEDGKMFKARSGDSVKLAELLEEAQDRAAKVVEQKNPDLPDDQKKKIAHAVGVGAVKYADLSKDRISDYVFDWDKMLSMEGNTAPYLQYAHARIKSILRKAFPPSPGTPGEGRGEGLQSQISNLKSQILLETDYEQSLAKHILRLGDVVASVARELKPHILCTYLFELATKYSSFYENCPVIQSPEPLRSSRLALCQLAARTLETGLDLLGIEHPDQM